ncbi:cytochrome P450 [Actinoalloteichus hoggarensis]|uniref:Pentalenic acid synthase n=1 Tax=Actinoalloteichus hoggarensis TaxID=1470176 RepID=A0A221W545_9PSEU|nr:cytochrome P450 [Actinoalloteichus hoggarensis]ASO20667.1 Pentalenic acid synthase [Actinoalloteichus hoggarensis]MBB5924480.1 cytochrome P450 [Actinoalloteichus hoggarensis]
MKADVSMDDLVYPFGRQDADTPALEYAWLREHHPLARVTTTYGTDAWLVTGYETVRSILSDDRFSSRMPVTSGAEMPEPRDDPTRSLFNIDPPDHTRLRRVLAGAFTAAQIQQRRDAMTTLARGLVDELVETRSTADLITCFVVPFTTGVIWDLLAVPPNLRPDFAQWVLDHQAIREPSWDPNPDTNPVLINRISLRRHVEELIAARRDDLGDDVVSRLIKARDAGEIDDDADVVVQLTGLIIAAYEPAFNTLGLALLALLADPERLRSLRSRPEAVPAAIEELLRHLAPTDIGFVRVASEDVEIGTEKVHAGEILILSLESANHDENVFAAADRLVLDRSPNPHMAFGHGRHHCLGAPLARAELAVALTTIAERLPTLRLEVPPESVPRRTALAQLGPLELPVSW